MRVRYSFSSRRTGQIVPTNKHREPYPKMVKEVIETSDIILEVLDARFLKETRNAQLEKIISEAGKKIIYIINKVDLVDSNIKEKVELLELMPYVLMSCKNRIGVAELRNRIKIEVKRLKLKETKGFERAQVGIIGYPNTGKSSLLNILAGGKPARKSPQAGFTRGIQKVRLSKGILLLDTPGVIPEDEYSPIGLRELKKHAKIGVRTYDKMKNPEFVLADLMRQNKGLFEKFYGVEANGDSEILINEIGKKRNFLKKGGIIDSDRAARAILKDWQEGKIK